MKPNPEQIAHHGTLARAQPLLDLRQQLNSYVTQHGYLDFDVISRDGIQIASGSNESLGENTLANLNYEFFDAVVSGASKVAQPFQLPSNRPFGPRCIRVT